MTDNMSKLAQQYKQRTERAQNDRIAGDRRLQLLQSKSSQAWKDLRTCLRKAVEEFNRALGHATPHLTYEEPELTRVLIRRANDEKTLTGEMKADELTAEFHTRTGGPSVFKLQLKNDDEASFATYDRHTASLTFHSPEEIAENLIAGFVNLS